MGLAQLKQECINRIGVASTKPKEESQTARTWQPLFLKGEILNPVDRHQGSTLNQVSPRPR